MARPSRRRLRRFARRAAFASAPLVGVALLAEGIARLVPPAPPEAGELAVLLSPHPTRIWGLTPGTFQEAGVAVQIGDDGLRAVRPNPGGLRVLTLGDSSIYGYGLPRAQTLHAALGRALAALGEPAEVRCGAVPGYSTEQALQLLEDQGWALEPEVLVVGTLWSDTNVDHFQDRIWMAAQREGEAAVERGLARSAAFRWLRRWLTPQSAWYLPVGWIRDPTITGQRRVPLADYRANLARLVRGGEAHGARSVLLAPANRIRMDDLRRKSPARHGWADWFEAMGAVAEDLDVPLVDVRDVLQAAGLTNDQAFLDDMHPTGPANAAIAAALAQAIRPPGSPGSAPPPGSGSAPGDPPRPHSTGGSPP